MQTRVDLENGKYTLVHTDGADFHALRNGSPWRDLGGDGLVLAAAQEIEELRAKLARVRQLAFEPRAVVYSDAPGYMRDIRDILDGEE